MESGPLSSNSVLFRMIGVICPRGEERHPILVALGGGYLDAAGRAAVGKALDRERNAVF